MQEGTQADRQERKPGRLAGMKAGMQTGTQADRQERKPGRQKHRQAARQRDK